jgi:Ni/Co efflux regulator RcnB
MKNTLLLIIAFVSLTSFAQSNEDNELSQYQRGMNKAFDLWQTDKSWDAANMFERIAAADSDNWLPTFYVAQINVLNSFSEKDKTKLTAQLGKARDFLNDAMAISKDNAEILVLEAQWYTAWIVYDGQQYGMTYSPKVAELYQKAIALAPENPRVVMGKTEWDVGSAQFFGQAVDKYCPELERAVRLFDTFVPEGEFFPQGGKEYAQSVLEKTCKQ